MELTEDDKGLIYRLSENQVQYNWWGIIEKSNSKVREIKVSIEVFDDLITGAHAMPKSMRQDARKLYICLKDELIIFIKDIKEEIVPELIKEFHEEPK